jgi:peptidyl-prolyl cis-trans isomerase A (cyclophilin A)
MTRRSSAATRAAFLTLAVVVASGRLAPASQDAEHARLADPRQHTEQAPEKFRANFDTTKGAFVVAVTRALAPNAADRFYNLVKSGYYNGNRFYFVNRRVAMWGVHGDPNITRPWIRSKIPSDPTRKQENKRGWVALSFGDGSAVQTLVHRADNPEMDSQVTPFGQIVSGLEVIDRLYDGYGEMYPSGKAPTMTHLLQGGNAVLERQWPRLDYINTATLVP